MGLWESFLGMLAPTRWDPGKMPMRGNKYHRHPGNGGRECLRRQRQIKAGTLTESNGLARAL